MQHPLFFFLLVFLVYAAVNGYIFYRGKQVLSSCSKTVRVIYLTLYLFLSVAFIVAMLGRNVLPLPIQKFLYFSGTLWLGAIIYLLPFFPLTDLLHWLNRFLRYLPDRMATNFRTIQVISGYLLVSCLMLYGYYQFTHPKIVEQKIVIHKKAGECRHLKIVGASDLHLGVNIDKKRLAKYVQLINEQHPDIIFFAGDIIDNNVLPLEKERMWEELNQLQAPLGVYACLGNHEYLSGIEAGMLFFQKTKLRLLVDRVEETVPGLRIIGRDNKQGNPLRKSLKELLEDTDTEAPAFLLDHEPHHLEEAEANGIDLQFSGHTHGGQLWPGNLLISWMYKLHHGYAQTGNTHYYVSSGLGLWGPPLRIATQSEIVVFNIEFN